MKKQNKKTSAAERHNSPLIDRKKLLWSALFVVIAAATVWAIAAPSEEFSSRSFIRYVCGTSKPWLFAAILSALGFIIFEGAALCVICRAFGYKVRFGRGFVYSASDIYFSAITPSASGGQPACAYFMIKDGIPGSVTTVVLLINVTMYSLAILVIGIFVAIFMPAVFMSFGLASKVLIILGYIVQIALVAFFVMLLVKCDLLHRVCRSVLRFLCKIRLLKREEEKQRKLDEYMAEYAECSEMIKSRKGAMAGAFIFNILQRASVISVSFFVFLAVRGDISKAAEIWAIQSYTVIGSNAVPIPGAMGVSDYIMLDGFGRVMPYNSAVNFELLSRSLSFYVCVVICAITVLIKYFIQKKARLKNDRLL